MNRRRFLKHSSTALAAAAAASYIPATFAAEKPLRLGLIGAGWYGKSSLLRALQVAPIEVVSLCDVDRKMLDEAAEMRNVHDQFDDPGAGERLDQSDDEGPAAGLQQGLGNAVAQRAHAFTAPRGQYHRFHAWKIREQGMGNRKS